MPSGSSSPRPPIRPALRWNFLLLVPLLVLATPLFNADEPRLFGFPFFYWVQFLFIPLSVVCVAMVYAKTGERR